MMLPRQKEKFAECGGDGGGGRSFFPTSLPQTSLSLAEWLIGIRTNSIHEESRLAYVELIFCSETWSQVVIGNADVGAPTSPMLPCIQALN